MEGPTNPLHYWTHLSLAPDKVMASPHSKRTLWLVVKENKSHRRRIRCHLLDGSDKYERSCTLIIKRWEKPRIYYQYLIRFYTTPRNSTFNREIISRVMVSLSFHCADLMTEFLETQLHHLFFIRPRTVDCISIILNYSIKLIRNGMYLKVGCRKSSMQANKS